MSIDILKLWLLKIVAVMHKICPHSRYLHILYVLLNDTEGRFVLANPRSKKISYHSLFIEREKIRLRRNLKFLSLTLKTLKRIEIWLHYSLDEPKEIRKSPKHTDIDIQETYLMVMIDFEIFFLYLIIY